MNLRKFEFAHDQAYLIEPALWRWLLLAEGGEGGEGGGGEGNGGGEGGEGSGGAGEGGGEGEGAGAGAGGEGGGNDPFYAGLEGERLEFAKSSTDLGHLVDRAMTMQRQLSSTVPRRDTIKSDEDLAKYRQTVGIPEAPDGYTFQAREGHEPTEGDLAQQKVFAEGFHKLDITAEQAKGLNELWNNLQAETEAAEEKRAKENAERSIEQLKADWKGDYDANKAHADAGALRGFGKDFDEAMHLKLEGGLPLLDHPIILRMLARYGAETAEGEGHGRLTQTEIESIDDKIAENRKKQEEALDAHNYKLANSLSEEERKLRAQKAAGSQRAAAG